MEADHAVSLEMDEISAVTAHAAKKENRDDYRYRGRAVKHRNWDATR